MYEGLLNVHTYSTCVYLNWHVSDSALKYTLSHVPPCCVCWLCFCSRSYVTSVVSPGLMSLSHWVFQMTLKFTCSPLIIYRCSISLLPSLTCIQWIMKIIARQKKLKFCHYLLIPMLFRTRIIFFLQWNTKLDVMQNVWAALFHTMKVFWSHNFILKFIVKYSYWNIEILLHLKD